MTFLAPLGLAALLALPIIVLLHLRRERLRRVAVSSLLLWQHVAPAAGKQRRRMLPLTLLLLLHLLIAALLALALGNPLWFSDLLGSGQRHTIAIIDSSSSMAAAEGLGSTRLEQARGHVRAVINGMRGTDRLSLITADTHARLLTTGGTGNRADLLAALDSIEAVGTGTDMADALTLARVVRESYQENPDEQLLVVSDLLPPADSELASSAGQIEWVRVGESTNNRAIINLAAEPQRGGAAGYNVYARVVNYDSNSVFTTLQLLGDDELIDLRDIDLQANGEVELTWNVPPGIKLLRAEMQGNDALPADDAARISLVQARPINLVLVSESSIALNRLLRVLNALPQLTINTVLPEEYALSPLAARADLTIFNGVLPDISAWPAGGVLAIDPPAREHPLLSVAADAPDAAQPGQEAEAAPGSDGPVDIRVPAGADDILQDLSLGGVDFGSLPRIEPPAWAQVQVLADETPLIMSGSTGRSEVAIWAFSLARGNITTKLAFPLLVARAVQDLTPPAPPEALLVGQTLELQPGPHTDRIEFQPPDGPPQQVPISQTVSIEGLFEPGLYTLTEYAGDEVVYEGTIAVNAGSPLESDLRPRPLQAGLDGFVALNMPAETETADAQSRAQETPQPLWSWLALAALAVMCIEWLYVHWR